MRQTDIPPNPSDEGTFLDTAREFAASTLAMATAVSAWVGLGVGLYKVIPASLVAETATRALAAAAIWAIATLMLLILFQRNQVQRWRRWVHRLFEARPRQRQLALHDLACDAFGRHHPLYKMTANIEPDGAARVENVLHLKCASTLVDHHTIGSTSSEANLSEVTVEDAQVTGAQNLIPSVEVVPVPENPEMFRRQIGFGRFLDVDEEVVIEHGFDAPSDTFLRNVRDPNAPGPERTDDFVSYEVSLPVKRIEFVVTFNRFQIERVWAEVLAGLGEEEIHEESLYVSKRIRRSSEGVTCRITCEIDYPVTGMQYRLYYRLRAADACASAG